MGVKVVGMREWQDDLRTLRERAKEPFKGVIGHAGLNIKKDWRARWEAIQSSPTHIPHLPRGIGYDTSEKADTYTVEVGVSRLNRQAFLSEIIEYGTLHSPPHPAGVPALEAEVPRTEREAVKVAQDLLDGKL